MGCGWFFFVFFVVVVVFFFNDTATTEIYTLSLHDALPISFISLANFSFSSAALSLGSTSIPRLSSSTFNSAF